MGRNKFILGGIMKSLLSTLLILALTGCAVGGSLKPEVTKRDEAREPCPFVTGTVVSVQDIVIEGNIEAAQASGTAIGGYLGNRATNDKGDIEEALGTIAGAAIGNVVGDAVGKGMAKPGVLLFIDINNGGSGISVSQEAGKYNFETGDKVILSGNLKQRRRGYPDNCPLRVFPQ